MKYQLTVTRCQSLKADRERTEEEIELIEKFEKFGAMLLWAQAWFQTTGANRHTRRDEHHGREYRPTEYAIAEGGHSFNLYRTEDFRQFTEATFLEGYLHGLANDEYHRSYGIKTPENGVHIVEVHQNAGMNGVIIVKTLYCQIIAEDGTLVKTTQEAMATISSDSRRPQPSMFTAELKQYFIDHHVAWSPEWDSAQ